MRLIDADELKETIGDLYGLPFEEMIDGFTWLKAIDNAPTVNLYTAYGEHIHMSDYPDEYKSCKGCKYYSYGCFNGHPCINCQRNFTLVDEIREQKNDLWKDGTSK